MTPFKEGVVVLERSFYWSNGAPLLINFFNTKVIMKSLKVLKNVVIGCWYATCFLAWILLSTTGWQWVKSQICECETVPIDVLRLVDVTTTPVGTMTSGGLLYVSGTSIHFLADDGTDTDLTAGGAGDDLGILVSMILSFGCIVYGLIIKRKATEIKMGKTLIRSKKEYNHCPTCKNKLLYCFGDSTIYSDDEPYKSGEFLDLNFEKAIDLNVDYCETCEKIISIHES